MAMKEEITYFNNGKIDLDEIAKENQGYSKVYMNAVRKEGVTDIILSREKGDILYILSNTEKKKYSDYFKKKKEDKVFTNNEKKESEGQPSKRTKQSTLFDFMKKK
ncbi:hypothetical protein [Encephalitozoon cuniculi GB-M1]|uniref:Uncharacterized protein n=2 Tax=Encephalitozoon cuniculi TaxID=6035 RepID=Q8SUI2_ENCCU|nr:uncharacterized protein ECU08_2040 [Encephalitozoon cuniculi GB-M1]AGE96601.1 hypothetical protein ECU08_2040 [Encephalitozoon cuniculi]KMV65727.1 hypothetical protein M970_082040 [Encephalitozoon cuniculi EcunIII-L]UYI27134.1 hypothetical protein J0A71_04g09860 [Encephalitozoon cuniculi]CAD26506.1 hypothetical protein [Encephalitozoon cuniculi GB-M1]